MRSARQAKAPSICYNTLMTQHENLKILAFVGLTGSGKSTAVENSPDSVESHRKFREKYREKNGKDAVAKKIVEQIHNLADAGQHRIIADGIYTWTEYKILKSEFPGELLVVATVAPRRLRYRRLSQREVRPLTSSEAYARDTAEIENLEKGGPIAIADHYVYNDGSVKKFDEQLDALAAELEFTLN